MNGKLTFKQRFLKGMTIFLVAATSVMFIPSMAVAAMQMVVTGNNVNLRSSPSTSGSVVGQVQKNNQVTWLETKGSWCKVSYNGVQGWVAGWLVAASPNDTKTTPSQPAPQTNTTPATQKKMQAVITGDLINVRSGPGSSYGAVAQVKKGEKYAVAEVKGQWVKIALHNGKAGWVAGWLISVSTVEPAPTPVAPVPTPSPPISTPTPNPPVPNPPAPVQPVVVDGKQAIVAGDNVYIRGGPGTSHGTLGQVSRGQKLGILEQAGDWYKVSMDEGVVGWIAGWLVNVGQAEASPSEGDPPNETEDTDLSHQMPAGVVTKLEQIAVNQHENRTVITLKSADQLNYDMFLLANPNRLVLDLKNTVADDLPELITVNSEAVQRIRTGLFQQQPPVLRVVIDLNGAVVNSDKLSADRTQLDLEIFVPEEGSYLQGRVIAIDPGHGGTDPGVIGSTGIKEKELNLDIALRLEQILKAKGAQVVMTRNSDATVGLYDRAPIANARGADVFLSIHNNGNTNPGANGTSTYYRRDTGDIAPGVSQADNRRLASAIQSELLRTLGRRNLGVLQANYVVIKDATMPAVLAEIAFVSNAEEEQLLLQDTFKQNAAEALARGLNTYFSTTN